MNELAISSGTALERVTRWSTMDPDERRRRATEACRDKDAAILWDLTLARLTLFGKAGARLSEHTTSAYRTGVVRLVTSWAGVQLLRATPNDGALYVRQMETAGLSPSTVSVRLAGARALYAALRWACTTTEHACNVDPFRDVHPAPDKTPAHAKRVPYSPAEFDALMAVATGEDRLLCLLAGHAGLRNAECCALRWADVDLGRGVIRVVNGKGGKTAEVTASKTLVETLCAAPRRNEYVISAYRTTEQARRRMTALCRRAGVQNRQVHSLRHHAGTKVQMTLGDIRQVARHLRHESTATSEIYIHHADHALENALADW